MVSLRDEASSEFETALCSENRMIDPGASAKKIEIRPPALGEFAMHGHLWVKMSSPLPLFGGRREICLLIR